MTWHRLKSKNFLLIFFSKMPPADIFFCTDRILKTSYEQLTFNLIICVTFYLNNSNLLSKLVMIKATKIKTLSKDDRKKLCKNDIRLNIFAFLSIFHFFLKTSFSFLANIFFEKFCWRHFKIMSYLTGAETFSRTTFRIKMFYKMMLIRMMFSITNIQNDITDQY